MGLSRSSKPLFILDECVSAKKDFSSEEFVQSVDLVDRGATDEEVFDVAKSLKLPVVTNDKFFALSMLAKNFPVIYTCKKMTARIEPKRVDLNEKYSDPITYHLIETDSIIIS